MSVSDNLFIPSADRDFFILLRAGLWQKADEPLSPTPDWDYIFRLSMEQTVQGIIADGLSLYRKAHPELSIPYDQSDPFLAACTQVMSRNRKVNQVQSTLCQLFDNPTLLPSDSFSACAMKAAEPSASDSSDSCSFKQPDYQTTRLPDYLPFVILKGQAVAQCYPKPELRVPGDIDFFFQEKDYIPATELIDKITRQEGVKSTSHTHYSTHIDGVEVELHGPEILTYSKEIKEVMEREFNRMFSTSHSFSYESEGTEIRVATPDFNALFLFMHALKHYFVSGLGIRQICDWTMFLHQHHADIDISHLRSALEEMKLLHAWQVFLGFCEDWLQLPTIESLHFAQNQESILPKAKSSIWTTIRKSGDMGHNKEDFYSHGIIVRNIRSIRSLISDSRLRHHLSPEIDNYMWRYHCKVYFYALLHHLHLRDSAAFE